MFLYQLRESLLLISPWVHCFPNCEERYLHGLLVAFARRQKAVKKEVMGIKKPSTKIEGFFIIGYIVGIDSNSWSLATLSSIFGCVEARVAHKPLALPTSRASSAVTRLLPYPHL